MKKSGGSPILSWGTSPNHIGTWSRHHEGSLKLLHFPRHPAVALPRRVEPGEFHPEKWGLPLENGTVLDSLDDLP